MLAESQNRRGSKWGSQAGFPFRESRCATAVKPSTTAAKELSQRLLAADWESAGEVCVNLPWGKADVAERKEAGASGTGRSLTQLAEGAAANLLEVAPSDYKEFRGKVGQLAQQMRDGLPEADRLALIREVIQEFEHYRGASEDELRNRLRGWRALASKLLMDLLARTGIDAGSGNAAPLVQKVGSLQTGTEIDGYLIELAEFFSLGNSDNRASRASQLTAADRSTANDNAAGLRGGGAAFKHVSRIMEEDNQGYLVLFQLGCLEMIGERFGVAAVQDGVMAVSAFLTHSLRSDDAIYHWSDSSLLAVLQTPASVPIVAAAMRRVIDNNRDITIQMGGRTVMLRVPLEFEIIPISRLTTAEDLNKLAAPSPSKW